MTQEPSMVWRDEYSTGVSSIDVQHRALLVLLQEVRAVAVGPQVGRSADAERQLQLERLNDYAAYHFLAEEALMREHLSGGAGAGADVAAHIAAHRAYWANIAAWRQRCSDDGAAVWPEVLRYLECWWLLHIQQTDKALGQRLNATGVR